MKQFLILPFYHVLVWNRPLCKRNFDATVVLVPAGANVRSLCQHLSDSHQTALGFTPKPFFFAKKLNINKIP